MELSSNSLNNTKSLYEDDSVKDLKKQTQTHEEIEILNKKIREIKRKLELENKQKTFLDLEIERNKNAVFKKEEKIILLENVNIT